MIARDPDGSSSLTFALVAAPVGMSVNAAGVIARRIRPGSLTGFAIVLLSEVYCTLRAGRVAASLPAGG